MKDPVSIPTGVAIDFGGLAAKVVVLMDLMPAVSSRRESDYLSFHLGFLPSFISAHFMTHPHPDFSESKLFLFLARVHVSWDFPSLSCPCMAKVTS